ncbi:MAG: UDP-3-O-(3-hydroxymyristoyl)glucosamine N-acyltransferase [Bacteroidales bacterium]|nr:UDP-3-O-(3-hydroxymyristoyl)glucosamine N-acyltransferase [Bacteroidales bacterium]
MKIDPPVSVKELAEKLGISFTGNPEHPVSGLNEIHMVEPGDITFVDHPKYYNRALFSKATTIIINKEVDCPEGKALLLSEDPFRDFMKMISLLRPFVPASRLINETSQIGEHSVIQPGAFIGNNVVIGKHCIIHPGAVIYDHCMIGDHVIIHSNSVIGADAFYFQRRSDHVVKFLSCGRTIINDHVEIGACSTVDRGVTGDTIIGEYTKFDNHVHIGHDTVIGKRCFFAASVIVGGVTRIGNDVTVWGQVAINKGLIIGDGVVLLGTSAVDKDLEGHKTYFGAPAEEAKKKWKEMAAIRSMAEDYMRIQKKTNISDLTGDA